MSDTTLGPDGKPLNIDPVEAADPKPDNNSDKKVDPSRLFSKGLKEGEQRAATKQLATLRALGVEIVDNNYDKSLESHINGLKKGAGDVSQVQEIFQKKVADLEAEKTKYQSDLRSAQTNYELKLAIKKFNVVDEADVFDIFSNRHKVEESEHGSRILDKNGSVQFNTDTGDPLTISDAIKKLLSEKPYLEKATTRGGAGGGDITGNGQDLVLKYRKLPLGHPDKAKILEKILEAGLTV